MDFLRRLIGNRRDGTSGRDPETGFQPAQELPPPPTMDARRGTIIPSTTDQLTTYRFLVGIISNPSMERTSGFMRTSNRPAANVGIYAHVVKNEIEAGKSYRFYSTLINSCLGLQIIVAAALTALGASKSSSAAVTVFGAINTVIAGFLTFLKGSGLPNRLQYYESEWAKVREFIEQQERSFSREGCPLDLYKVVAVIEEMYNEVKQDVDSTKPDKFISVSSMRRAPTLPSAITPALAQTSSTTKDLQSYLGGKASEIESRFGNKAEETGRHVNEYWEKGEGEITDARRGVYDFADARQTQATEAIRDTYDYEDAQKARVAEAARTVQSFADQQRAQLAQDVVRGPTAAAEIISPAPEAPSGENTSGVR